MEHAVLPTASTSAPHQARPASGRRILFVIGANQIGGSERQAWALVRALREADADARLVFLDRPRRRVTTRLPLDGVPHRYLWSGRWTRGFATRRLRRLLKSFAPDAVFLYNVEAMQHGVAACPDGRSSLVGSVRGLQFTRMPAVADQLRAAAASLACVTTNCRAIAQAIAEAGITKPGKIHVIPNAIEIPRAAPSRAASRLGRPLVLFAGSLKEVKAPEVFVEAASIVHRELPQARFLMAGDGPLREATLRQRARLGLEEVLSAPGVLQARSIPFGEAAVVVSTSWREGASNTLLEAFAHGTPVVATAVGGSTELVEDSGGGILVEPGSPDAVAQAILRVLDDPDRWNQMQEGARDYVQSNCSIDRVVERHLQMVSQFTVDREA